MNILISNSSDVPIYEQITKQIKEQIINGELGVGEMIPSIRNLAKELQISVITTKRAYEELERDGFIVTIPGKGSYVNEINVGFIREQKLKTIEDLLNKAVDMAKTIGLTKKELIEILDVLYEG